jgi:hypothetical protein
MTPHPKTSNRGRSARWRARVVRFRAELAHKHAEVKKNAVPYFLSVCLGALAFLMRDFLQLGSWLFFLGAIGILFVMITLWYRYYIFAFASFLVLLCVLVVLSIQMSSYFIASDGYRLQYRESPTASYVEFPARVPILRYAISLLPGRTIVDVITCGDAKVARLPLLPYKPLYESKHILGSPFGFRRLPPLRFDFIELIVKTAVETESPAAAGALSSDGTAQKNGVSLTFGFTDRAYTVVALTALLPRSVTCLDKSSVPLIPIFEVLPWDPDETQALIEAAARVNVLRAIYEAGGSVSLDTLTRLQLPFGAGPYKSLLDFFIYSGLSQMLYGNILAEARTDAMNKLCVTMETRPWLFAGPFVSLKQNVMQMLTNLDQKHRSIYAACPMSADQPSNREPATSQINQLPWMQSFQRCIENASSVTECLMQGEALQEEKPADQPQTRSLRGAAEAKFEAFDSAFNDVVATDTNALVAVESLKPSECRALRDRNEDNHFIEWWEARANNIMMRPFKCASPEWKQEYARSYSLAKDIISCGKRKGIRDDESLRDVETRYDWQYQFRCELGNNLNVAAQLDEMYALADKLDEFILKLKLYSELIGRERMEDVVRGFEMASKMRRAACGERDTALCAKEYSQPGGLQKLRDKVLGMTDIATVFGGDLPQTFDNLERLDNVVVNIALCDILQNEVVRKRVGRTRDEFCDSHGLYRYRLVSSEEVGRSIRRMGNQSKRERSYFFKTDGRSREYLITVPTGD